MSYKTLVRKHNTFYKITNLINGKYYFGIHSTDRLNDSYFGGGIKLRDAINKYGKENFVKEIIADYPTRKEASDHERLIVTKELVESDQCYNIRTGGDNEVTISRESAQKISKALTGKKQPKELVDKRVESRKKTQAKKTPEERSAPYIGVRRKQPRSAEYCKAISLRQTGKKMSDETKQKMKDYYEEFGYNMTGKHHSEATKKKMRETKADKEGTVKYQIFGIVYRSASLAAFELNIKPFQVRFRANSELEKWKDWLIFGKEIIKTKPKFSRGQKCIINGIIFDSLDAAGNYFQITGEAIKYRIMSKNERWKDFNFLNLSEEVQNDDTYINEMFADYQNEELN